VVTEYGIARLAGRSQRQRAENLIAIAHPDHRGELRRARQIQFFPNVELGIEAEAEASS
ncbi:MAG: propionyl-CoA--succinate CoA transferase, partial [Solirubrobacterales bacterium]|nr:propionyl-CoA--succinate CoA transferase [Solirubrobacterales bacterium]